MPHGCAAVLLACRDGLGSGARAAVLSLRALLLSQRPSSSDNASLAGALYGEACARLLRMRFGIDGPLAILRLIPIAHSLLLRRAAPLGQTQRGEHARGQDYCFARSGQGQARARRRGGVRGAR